jgi:adenylate cyclase
MNPDAEQPAPAQSHNEKWRRYLAEGHSIAAFLRGLFRLAPASPRCATCYAPFQGIGGKILGVTRFAQSRKAPRFCRMCCESQPLGGAEVDAGVFFADVRGYTSLAEEARPEDVARTLNRFYALASDALVAHDALIDKLMGDEVMALFLPGFTGKDYVTKMVSAAEALMSRLGYGSSAGPWLPIGIGLDHGVAFVGNIGTSEVNDFTALGDVVNTAARLQAAARPGQILMSERVYEEVSARFPDAARVELDLKGKSAPVSARVVEVAGPESGARVVT